MLLALAAFACAEAPPIGNAPDCWLWPGALPARCEEAARLYVLQGHFHRDGHFERRGPSPGRSPRPGREIVPVYRMDALPRNGALAGTALPDVYAWRKQGWRVPGLQVDFDSPTAKLARYARWLTAENARLREVGNPTRIVSVTGLGDWLTAGHRADLRRLNGAAGLIAFMFYHRGRGIEPVETYIDALRTSSLRFKIGLLPAQHEDGRLVVLRNAAGYRGEIVFHGQQPMATRCIECNDMGSG